MEIPKIIHYCWFGDKILPKSALKCIESWRAFFPDYKIKEWNESNFDVDDAAFTRIAYKEKLYAHVSDYARLWILYHEGGIYFDIDVTVLSSFDDILKKGAFIGVETPSRNGSFPTVNPGLGFGVESHNPVIGSMLKHYSSIDLAGIKKKNEMGTIVTHTTLVLREEFGLQPTNAIQELNGITVYPADYFNPLDDATGILTKTSNTRSIHWFAKTWIKMPYIYFELTRFLHRILGIHSLRFYYGK